MSLPKERKIGVNVKFFLGRILLLAMGVEMRIIYVL
jgi:hypothetical protein